MARPASTTSTTMSSSRTPRLPSVLLRHRHTAATHLLRPRQGALTSPSSTIPPHSSIHNHQSIRHRTSSVRSFPVQLDPPTHPRIYPFPYELRLVHPSNESPDYSVFEKQWAAPNFKVKLTVKLSDLHRSNVFQHGTFQGEIFTELVGARYSEKHRTVSFVSREAPTKQANENRVYQMLDAVLAESQRLAEELSQSAGSSKSTSSQSQQSSSSQPIDTSNDTSTKSEPPQTQFAAGS